MIDPYQLLGIKPTATPEQIRHAYHLQAKKWHPDRFQDPDQQKIAQEKMTLLNLAYQQALRLEKLRSAGAYRQELTCEDAVKLSRKMMAQGHMANALRELMRAATRTAVWYYQQGLVLMELQQYQSSIESFREAIRRDPDNNAYRRGVLQATLAFNHSKTVLGRIEHMFHIPAHKRRKTR